MPMEGRGGGGSIFVFPAEHSSIFTFPFFLEIQPPIQSAKSFTSSERTAKDSKALIKAAKALKEVGVGGRAAALFLGHSVTCETKAERFFFTGMFCVWAKKKIS